MKITHYHIYKNQQQTSNIFASQKNLELRLHHFGNFLTGKGLKRCRILACSRWACNLVVTDLRLKTKGSRFKSSC